ncbi:MAG TPA: hypothetical protein DET40_18710 [Lentisphaeria bacterium]|nr:MAG: hypothetical protein A2X45_25655 [Lentisphaerae bacterium GWF2_50_93]HCE45577.1 hypothetical protein [Lentisphaeria bacterium]
MIASEISFKLDLHDTRKALAFPVSEIAGITAKKMKMEKNSKRIPKDKFLTAGDKFFIYISSNLHLLSYSEKII